MWLDFRCLLIDIMVLSFDWQLKIEGWRFAGKDGLHLIWAEVLLYGLLVGMFFVCG